MRGSAGDVSLIFPSQGLVWVPCSGLGEKSSGGIVAPWESWGYFHPCVLSSPVGAVCGGIASGVCRGWKQRPPWAQRGTMWGHTSSSYNGPYSHLGWQWGACVALAFLGKAVSFPDLRDGMGWDGGGHLCPLPLRASVSAWRGREGSPWLNPVWLFRLWYLCVPLVLDLLAQQSLAFFLLLLKTCVCRASENTHLQSVPDSFWHLQIPWCRTNRPWVCPSQLCYVGFLTKDTKFTEKHTNKDGMIKFYKSEVFNQLSTFSVAARWEWLQCL